MWNLYLLLNVVPSHIFCTFALAPHLPTHFLSHYQNFATPFVQKPPQSFNLSLFRRHPTGENRFSDQTQNGQRAFTPLHIKPKKKAPIFNNPLAFTGARRSPRPFNPSEFKDRIIFGSPAAASSSPQQDSSPLVDALTLSLNSPRPPSSASLLDPTTAPPQGDPQTPQGWLIDPNYSWTNTNLHRSKTAPAMAVLNEVNRRSGPKPQVSSQSIVRQAVILLIAYLTLGVIIYWFNRDHFAASETHPVVDALYFCIVTMCTIGYGDITPKTTATKLFSIMFVLVGFGFIDILLSGMVAYVLDLQESYLLRSVKGVGEKKESYIIDVKKGRMRIRMKVGLALGVVVLCIGVGAMVMHYVEKLGWLDSFYLSVMSVTTVGYGDRAFQSMEGRIFASIWLLVSTLAVARAFLYLAEARVDKRHRKMAKWVLGQDMTVSEFLAADIDNNGFVSKSEYVVYKLKEMGKVSEKDIMQISNKFDRLDAGNCGKITLADLMSRH